MTGVSARSITSKHFQPASSSSRVDAIGTSNPDLAYVTLDALQQAGVEFAIVHGEEAVATRQPLSDIDVVVNQPPLEVLRASIVFLHAAGLHPITINPYDAGGSASVMIATEDGLDGLQLDLLFDPHERGRFGLHTNVLLESRAAGRRWPVVAPECQIVYLIRKRHWKGDVAALQGLRRRSEAVDKASLEEAIQDLAGAAAARGVRRVLEGYLQDPFHVPLGNKWADLHRRVERIRTPVGYWVDLVGTDRERDALDLTRRFGRYLANTRATARPEGMLTGALWLVRAVVPVRLRTGLVISYSRAEHR